MHRLALLSVAVLLASCSGAAGSPTLTVPPPATSASDLASPAPVSSASAAAPSAPSRSSSPSLAVAADLEGQIAYVGGMDPQIHLLDLATGERRQLTDLRPEHAELSASGPMRPALSCGFGPSGLTWSPDGERLAFTYGSCDAVVYVVDLDGDLRRIGDGRGPAWSPDGTRLVHGVNVPYSPCGAACLPEPEPGSWDLRILELAGAGESRPLTADGSTAAGGAPLWSSDGSTIAYNAPPPSGAAAPGTFSATYLIDAAGGEPRLVGNGAYPTGWHPDGRLLVRMESDSSIRAVDLETGDSSLVAPPETSTVSPDATLFMTNEFDSASGEARGVLRDAAGHPLASVHGHGLAWAPDSTHLAASTEGGMIVILGRDGSRVASYRFDADAIFGPAAWRPGS
jgi:Tol biopolymer transport system component